MNHTINIGRQTLLHKHPHLKFGYDSERNVFWIVTSLIAILLTMMLILETLINWKAISASYGRTLFTSSVLLCAAVWVIIPVFLNKKFPLWAGLIGYITVMSIAAYHFAFSTDQISINTSMQILPISALYLGWFWRPIPARIIFTITMVIFFYASHIGVGIGVPGGVSRTIILLIFFIAIFSFTVGSVMRWQLQRMAMTDRLTGVLNFRGIKRAIRAEIIRSKKQGTGLTLAFVDFDRFKAINDTRGHAFGDHVLTSTTQDWRKDIRSYDKIGRIGGDEFLIVFPDTSAVQAASILGRLRNKAEFGWTWGLASLKEGDTIESMIERADKDLYFHKSRRRSQESLKTNFSLNESLAHESLLEKKVSFIQRMLKNQTDLSVMTAFLSFVVTFALTISFIFNDSSATGVSVTTTKIFFFGISIFITFYSLTLGRKLPTKFAYLVAGIVLIMGIILILLSKNFYSALSLMFSVSMVSLYLGVFLGTMAGRIMIVSAIAINALTLILRSWDGQPEYELVAIASGLYALITQLFLFEIGSYLYSRSRQHAHHDALTGVLNRFGLEEYANAEIQRANRRKYKISLAIIDCNDFKKINDVYGHQKGDELLLSTAKHFISGLDIYDLVARIGGDEYLILFPYLTASEATHKLEKLKIGSPLNWDYGVSPIYRDDRLDEAIARADQRLYDARAATRAV